MAAYPIQDNLLLNCRRTALEMAQGTAAYPIPVNPLPPAALTVRAIAAYPTQANPLPSL